MTQGRGTALRVAMIGHAFMGAAHSQAWRSAPRFFKLPRDVVMAVVCGTDAGRTGAAAERMGWAEAATDWRAVVSRDDIDIVGGAGDRASVLAGIGDTQPDIVLLDAIAPDFGTDLVADILDTAPGARVVVLSGLAGARAQDERIAAHVTKDASFDELEDVLRRIAAR